MKSLHLNVRKYRFQILLLALLCCGYAVGYAQSKATKAEVFYAKIVTLKPGMTKEEVKTIMGEPYKISFTTNEKQELVEDVYYKTSVYVEKWTIITYQCVFVDSKLVSLLQKEIPYSTTEFTVSDK